METVTATVRLLLLLLSAVVFIGQGCTADAKTLEDVDPLTDGSDLSNDFENGALSPWFDNSPGLISWKVENVSSPIETNYPAPPKSGSKYLRINRLTPNITAGLAVVRSPTFTAQPGDLVIFSFWIQSKDLYGNSLKVRHNQVVGLCLYFLSIIFTGLKLFQLINSCTMCKTTKIICSSI